MNRAKKAIVRTQQFVSDHKVGIAITATAAATTAVMVKVRNADIKRLNEFLDEHGLTEKFYNPEA